MLIYTLGDHSKQNDHVRGRNHFDDAGKPGALKGARRVWRGAFKKGLSREYLVGCLPYLPALVQPSARMTNRLRLMLQTIGLATGGEVGARLASRLGMQVSPPTLLRCLRAIPSPSSKPVRVLGIDDWSYKRGQTFGTILVDLERHQVIDLFAVKRD